ncbi:MAG: squalene synthase HpnC [Acidimicrobiales bacterium]|nr:squalene synthase HpnC [Acidimicrobiales bacterium]
MRNELDWPVIRVIRGLMDRSAAAAPSPPRPDAGAGALTGVPAGVPAPLEVERRARGENFPVASLLLPSGTRPHILAVYGFARLVDQLGDDAPGDRLALLSWLEDELRRAYEGRATYPLLRRLSSTIATYRLPEEPFLALIEANRRDQIQHRYPTWDDLLSYCELSANPVGRLVLHLFGAATADRERWSDAVCSGLQLVEHAQDVREDARRGRVYLPEEDLRSLGCDTADLTAATTSPALAAVLARLLSRAGALLEEGYPLVDSLRGRARLAVAGFVGGGRAAVSAIEAHGYEVLAGSPRPGKAEVAREVATTLWRARRRSFAGHDDRASPGAVSPEKEPA